MTEREKAKPWTSPAGHCYSSALLPALSQCRRRRMKCASGSDHRLPPPRMTVYVLLHRRGCPTWPQVTGLWRIFSALVNSSSGKRFENWCIQRYQNLITSWWITSLWGLILRFNTKKSYTKWKHQQELFWWSRVFLKSLKVWVQRGPLIYKGARVCENVSRNTSTFYRPINIGGG